MSWDYGSRAAMLLEQTAQHRFNAAMNLLAQAIADLIRAATLQPRREQSPANESGDAQARAAHREKRSHSKRARRGAPERQDGS
jgi:hypothetical protein